MRWWLGWGALGYLPAPGPIPGAVLPPAGSLCGGSTVRLHAPGRGHLASNLQVSFGPAPCQLSAPANCTVSGCDVTCITTSIAADADTRVDVMVRSGLEPPVRVGEFTYSAQLTPVVTDFGPNAGQGGDMVHMVGTKLDDAEVSVGGIALTKRFGGDLLAQVVVPRLPPGDHPVKVWTPRGYACTATGTPALSFRAVTSVQSVQGARKGSLGGGGSLIVVGQGLEGANATLCGSACNVGAITPEPRDVHAGEDYQALTCTPAAFEHTRAQGATPVTPEVACDLHLTTAGDQRTIFPQAWTYAQELTPSIRGVSAAGLVVTVNGAGFTGGDAVVTVDGLPCATSVVREDYLTCALSADTEGVVAVSIAGKGNAVPMFLNAALLMRPTPPPHIPVETMSAFTSTLCRATTLSTDCPAGWSCCPMRELQAPYGRCAATCAQGSFLSRTTQAVTPGPMVPR